LCGNKFPVYHFTAIIYGTHIVAFKSPLIKTLFQCVKSVNCVLCVICVVFYLYLFFTDLYTALQELDHLSSRKPSILDTFCEPISELLLSPTSSIRTLAHLLFARHLRYNPAAATASTGVAAFLRCLESDHPDILNSALDRLPEIVVCAQGKQVLNLTLVLKGICNFSS
jgi:hypothetical protein